MPTISTEELFGTPPKKTISTEELFSSKDAPITTPTKPPMSLNDRMGFAGQLIGGIGGSIAMPQHPYAGGAAGAVAGRGLMGLESRRLQQQPTTFNQQTLMTAPLNPIMSGISAIETMRKMPSKDRQQFAKEIGLTAGVEAIAMPIAAGTGKILEGAGSLFGKALGSGKMHQTVLKVRTGLRDYLTKINTEFGERLEKVLGGKANEVFFNQTDIADVLNKRLLQYGAVDPAGNFIGKSAREKALYDFAQDLATRPNKVSYAELKSAEKGIRNVALEGKKAFDRTDSLIANFKGDIGIELEKQGIKGIPELNKWYAPKRELYNQGERMFQPFGNEYGTDTGISKLLDYYNAKKEGSQLFLNKLEKEIGVPFTRLAKRHSAFLEAGKMPLVGRGVDAATGIGRFAGSFAPTGYQTSNVLTPFLYEMMKKSASQQPI